MPVPGKMWRFWRRGGIITYFATENTEFLEKKLNALCGNQKWIPI
jgi:hypothetical protein